MRLTKRYKNGAVTIDAEIFGVDQGVLDSEINSSKPVKAAVARLAKMEDRLPYNAECGNCKNCTQGKIVYDRYCEELERNCYTMSFCSYYERSEE